MRIRKVINRTIHSDEDGVQVAGAVNAVIAANVGEGGAAATAASSRQRIVQRSARRVRKGGGRNPGAGDQRGEE